MTCSRLSQNYRTWNKPHSLSVCSFQVEVTTTGVARVPPTLRPCGPVAPAGTAWEDAGLSPPRLPPLVRPSPPPLHGPSMATAWGVLAAWLEGVFVSGVLVPPRPRGATSTMSSKMRRSLSYLLPLFLFTPCTFLTLCSRDSLYPGGTAGPFR